MRKEFYIGHIEKKANLSSKIVDGIIDNKIPLSAIGAGAGALGSAYLLSDKEDRSKIKNGVKTINTKRKESNRKNSKTKTMLRGGGALAGTMLSLNKGKSLQQAIVDGGIAGTAIGDMVGTTVLPTRDLYKQHKEEFGTRPDVKSVAKVVGANAIPSAALWGSVYGLKNGAIKKGISNNISSAIDGASQNKDELLKTIRKYQGKPELINSVGMDNVKKKISKNVNGILNNSSSIPFAMLPISVARNSLTSIPGSLVTPESVIEKKKQEIENKSMNK